MTVSLALAERMTTNEPRSISTLRRGDLDEYRDDIVEYLDTPEYTALVAQYAITRKRLWDLVGPESQQVGGQIRTVAGLMTWMRAHQRGPWAPATVPQGDSVPTIFTEAATFGRMAGPTPPGGRDGHDIRMDMARYIHEHIDQWRDALTGYVAEGLNTDAALRDVLNSTAVHAGILWLPDFARWYIDQHPTTTPTEGAPMTAALAEFRRRYNLITRTDAHGNHVSTGNDGGNVQAAFIALPTEVKQLWRTLYNEAAADNRFSVGGVPDFDRSSVGTIAYGFSTECFFIYAHTAGITIGDNGGPVIPGVDPNNQPAAVPQGDGLPEIARLIDAGTLTAASLHGDARFALLAPVRDLVRQWWNVSEGGTGDEYVDFLVTGQGVMAGAWNRYVNGNDDSYLNRLVTYLRDHRAEIAPTPQEATIPTTTDHATPVVVPIGPDHPGWVEFAARMAQVATENSMCPEYDRIAREMGLPTRKTEIVTRITLEVPVTIERGNNVDDRTLREAARALLEQNGTVSRANRTEVRRTETVG